MRKLISSINITLDGFCDHTAMIADDDLHEHVNELLRSVDTILFGRKTYQLMEEGWPPLVNKPSGNKPMDDFAILIDNDNKVVFSKTLNTVTWKNTKLLHDNLEEEVVRMKQETGKNILVGGPTLIRHLMTLHLIDEYQFCVHPVILGKGLPLFNDSIKRTDLKLLKTTPYALGAVNFYYELK